MKSWVAGVMGRWDEEFPQVATGVRAPVPGRGGLRLSCHCGRQVDPSAVNDPVKRPLLVRELEPCVRVPAVQIEDGSPPRHRFVEPHTPLASTWRVGVIERAAAHDLFDRHLPLLRYEQQPGMLGLAVRKYILKRRGAIASDAQRKPGVKLSKEAIAEIEFLIARLERNN